MIKIKKFSKIKFIVILISTIVYSGCNDDFPSLGIGLDDVNVYSIEEYNIAFFEGKIANTPESAASVIYLDKDRNILTNEKYWSMAAEEVPKLYEPVIVSLEDFNTLVDDEYATMDYLKVIPMTPEQTMFIHDPYANNNLRMSHQEQAEVYNEYLEKVQENNQVKLKTGENETIACDNGANVCTGDVFFQWGNYFDYTATCDGNINGSSTPGHISIVELGHSPCMNTPRLKDVHIFEAWFTGKNSGTTTIGQWFQKGLGSVRHVKSHDTWGWTANEQCANFWHNTYLDSRQNKKDQMRTFLSEEHGTGYGWNVKDYAFRPIWYYCSLLNWKMYWDILGWDFDQDGGAIVSPNDQGMYMYYRSNMYDSWWYSDHFEHCDF